MNRATLGVVLAVSFVGAAMAQDKNPLPKGAEPSRIILARMAKEKVIFTDFVNLGVTIEVPGKPKEDRSGPRKNEKPRNAADVRGFDMNGKPIAQGKLASLLEKDTLVVLSYDFPVDPFYLSVFKKETLNLVLPKTKAIQTNQFELPSPEDK